MIGAREVLTFSQYKGIFSQVFYMDFRDKAFNPKFAYKAMARAYNKTESQIRAHATASGYIDRFNDKLAVMIQAADDECSQQAYEELDRKVEEMIEALTWTIFLEIHGGGGRGWPSPDKTKQILAIRKLHEIGQQSERQRKSLEPERRAYGKRNECVYTLQEIAELLKVSRSTVYKWRDTGKVKAFKVGGTYRVLQSEVDMILEGNRKNRETADYCRD